MSNDKLAHAIRRLRRDGSGYVLGDVACSDLLHWLEAHEAEKQATLTIEAPSGDKIVAHGSAVDMMTLERIVKAKAEKQAEPVAIQAPDDSDLLTIAYLSGAHDAKRQLNLNDRVVQKRLAAQWGYVQAPAVAHDVPTSPPTEQDKEDAESALKWLYEEGCDLRARSDDDYGYVVVEHYMAKPHERVIGRGDKPLDAIRAARAKKEQP